MCRVEKSVVITATTACYIRHMTVAARTSADARKCQRPRNLLLAPSAAGAAGCVALLRNSRRGDGKHYNIVGRKNEKKKNIMFVSSVKITPIGPIAHIYIGVNRLLRRRMRMT